MEQKETDAHDKAAKLISAFEESFLAVRSTFHPAGLPGEIAGKSSNVAFAARHIVQVHRTELSTGSCNVIATVMDGKPQQYSCLGTHPELIKNSRHTPLAGLLHRNPPPALCPPRRR